MENIFKYNIGDRVVYDGIIGIVESRSVHISDENGYGLVSEEDSLITCTAMESDIEAYNGEEIDQSESIEMARLSSKRITNMISGITDKYFRDGNH